MNQLLNSTSIYRVGCYDPDIDLFESQYVVPQGVTYNSYVIVDEKVAILDTVDPRKTGSGWPTWTRFWAIVSPTTWWCTTWNRTTLVVWPKWPSVIPR